MVLWTSVTWFYEWYWNWDISHNVCSQLFQLSPFLNMEELKFQSTAKYDTGVACRGWDTLFMTLRDFLTILLSDVTTKYSNALFSEIYHQLFNLGMIFSTRQTCTSHSCTPDLDSIAQHSRVVWIWCAESECEGSPHHPERGHHPGHCSIRDGALQPLIQRPACEEVINPGHQWSC